MKWIIALIGAVAALQVQKKTSDVYEGDETNGKKLWKGDWEYYRKHHAESGDPMDENNCRMRESKNFLGAQ